MIADAAPETDLEAAVDDAVRNVVDQVVANSTVSKLGPISASASLTAISVDMLVGDALSDMSGEFHDLQSHLDDFLHIIRQHVITPGSPSSSSDISDWNDLSKWPDVRPRNEGQRTCSHKAALDVDDAKRSSEALHDDVGEQKSGDNPIVRRTASSQMTVEVFRRAFETGNFSEVEAIMSSYSIESQLARVAGPNVNESIRARLRRDALKPPAEPSVPLPSMMVTRNLTDYVPDKLPSMAASLPAPRRTSIDSLVVERRSSTARPARTTSQRHVRPLELQVIKHGRHGKPKFKRLSVDTSLGVISWGTGSILMADIRQIRCGRQTHVLNRSHAAQAYEGLFTSIVTPTRTLDLEMRSRTERNQAVGQIQQLVAEYLKTEKNQHVVWNRHDIDNSDLDHQIMVGQMTTYRTSRLSSWKSALVKFLYRRRTAENSWTTEHL